MIRSLALIALVCAVTGTADAQSIFNQTNSQTNFNNLSSTANEVTNLVNLGSLGLDNIGSQELDPGGIDTPPVTYPHDPDRINVYVAFRQGPNSLGVLEVHGSWDDDTVIISTTNNGEVMVVTFVQRRFGDVVDSGQILFDRTTIGHIKVQLFDGFDMLDAQDADESVTARGGPGNDILIGGQRGNTMYGQQGDDTLAAPNGTGLIASGGDGADEITGTNSVDSLRGGDGADIIDGRGGNDTILGGDGNDLLLGGRGNDLIKGEDGDDYVAGEEGDDNLHGGNHYDYLTGSFGRDRLDGGYDGYFDRLEGGPDRDTFIEHNLIGVGPFFENLIDYIGIYDNHEYDYHWEWWPW